MSEETECSARQLVNKRTGLINLSPCFYSYQTYRIVCIRKLLILSNEYSMGVIYVKLSGQPCFRASELKIPQTCNASGLFSQVQLKCDGTQWRTGGEVKGKLASGVGGQYPSHYLGTWCIQHYYRWCAHLGCQYSTEQTPPPI